MILCMELSRLCARTIGHALPTPDIKNKCVVSGLVLRVRCSL